MDDPFFAKIIQDGLPDSDLAALGSAYRSVVQIEAQVDLIGADHAGTQLHVLLGGWACKYRLMADGRRQLLRIHLPGEICDVEAICGAPSSEVLALTDCRLATISLDWIRALADERPAVRALLWSFIAEETAAMAEQLVSLGRRTARERTAFFLCELLDRLQALGEASGNSFRLPMTQVDIGDYLGLSTVHINRTLQDLKNEGLIQHGGRTFTVCDRDELERFAGYIPSRTRSRHAKS